MTKAVTRLYVIVGGVLAFFCAWVAVATHPWAPQPGPDPRIAALAARQQRVQAESIRVKHIVDVRWATYQQRLAAHNVVAARRIAAQAQQVAARAQQVAAQQVAAQRAAAQPIAAVQTYVSAQPAAPSVAAQPIAAARPAVAAPAYVAPQPSVRVVNLPALVVTKVS